MVPSKQDEVAYAYNPSTQEAGTRGKGVWDHCGLHSKTVSLEDDFQELLIVWLDGRCPSLWLEGVSRGKFETGNTAWCYSAYQAGVWGSGSIPQREDVEEVTRDWI